ncbi:MAG: flagellin [Clostridium sp.]|nr:flagellin [Clostridium sp.]
MRLNQNMQSLNVYRNYKKNLVTQSIALDRISTGTKINSAKDNPNKLGVSEGLRIQIRGLQMAERNIQDGVSMMQSVDGALNTVSEALNRIKELTVQAGGVQNDEDLSIIQGEINQLKEHIDYTVNNSEFNGVKLLNSDKVTNNDYPKYLNHVVGANTKEEINIPVFNVTKDMLIDLEGNSLKNINIPNTNELDKNLNIVDSAIETMNSVRSRYGAIQNRMDTSAQNLSGSSFNLENAESRIRDSDIALEMAEYARTSILHETSIALMQQTNRFPQDVLRVLENMK